MWFYRPNCFYAEKQKCKAGYKVTCKPCLQYIPNIRGLSGDGHITLSTSKKANSLSKWSVSISLVAILIASSAFLIDIGVLPISKTYEKIQGDIKQLSQKLEDIEKKLAVLEPQIHSNAGTINNLDIEIRTLRTQVSELGKKVQKKNK